MNNFSSFHRTLLLPLGLAAAVLLPPDLIGQVSTTGDVTPASTSPVWAVPGDLTVGLAAPGTLSITLGGSVSVGANSNLANAPGTTGIATISGGSWTTTNTLRIGEAASGTLEVSGTGQVSSADIVMGLAVPATGVARISGGTLNVATNLTIGFLGSGTLETSGTGSVTVAAGGTVDIARLAGSSGTLRIGVGAAAGSFSADQITGGLGTAAVEFNHSDSNLAFAPVLAGSLSVRQIGSGTTVLNTANSFAGGTTVQGGTLQTQNASALGTGGVTVTSGTLDPVAQLNITTLTWNGGTIATALGTATDLVNISGNISLGGGGNFSFTAGAGFSTNNTYIILSAANLSDALLSLFSGNSLLGLTPVFTRSGTNLLVSFTGASTGPLLENVGGPWTPTTANFVVSGPVQTGNAAASNTVNSLIFNPNSSLQVFNNLTVTSGGFNVPAGTATLSGGTVIAPGNFNKTGAGNLTTDTNIQVGSAANIQGGGLFVNGRLSAPGGVTVFQNALLGGSGLIVGNVLNNGTLAPGNSPGTLTINGSFTQSTSGTLQIEIASPSVFDRLVVSGAANLAGTLQALNLGPALEYGQTYAFLEAGSITGDFDQILMPLPGSFRGRFLVEGGTGTLLVAPASYTLVAETPNQRRVAKALDSYITASSGDRQTVSIALDIQSADQYPGAFDQIAPGFYESLAEITIGQAFAQTQMINQRLSSVRLGARGFQAIGLDEQPLRHDKDGKSTAEAKSQKSVIEVPDPDNWSAWVMGTGIFGKSQGLSGVPNYRSQAGGFLAGADYAFGPQDGSPGPSLAAGIYGGYNYTYAKYSGGSSTQVNSALFGLYGTFAHGGFYADAVVGGGYNDYKANRSIEFSTVDRTARSSPDGGQFNAAINLGYDWHVSGFTFGPIAGFQYTYAGIAPFTEQGANSLDLRVSQQNANSMISTLGGRVAYTWTLAKNISLIPEARIFWQHEFLDNPRGIGAALDGGAGPSFSFQTSTPDRDSVFTGAGISAQFGEKWNSFLFYNADFGRTDYVSHAISAGLGLTF